MHNNKTIITEPRWKRYIVETNKPIFTSKLCKEIIDLSTTLEKEQGKILRKETDMDKNRRNSTICWIDFNKMQPVYNAIDNLIQKINRNNFGFNDIQITERAQFAEYFKGQFYEWHTDNTIDMDKEPPVRKLSMTVLLNDPKEFEGGNLEIVGTDMLPMKQGHATIFASFLQHRVTPITKGVRRSLVMWFGGEPFK